MPPAAQAWIHRLGLQPHPEGGYFKEVYRSKEILETSRGPRTASTAIYFLLTRAEFSAFHRIGSDEIWHHYAGGVVEIHGLEYGRQASVQLLGNEPDAEVLPQQVIPAGKWFAARMSPGHDYALVGCTVSPGFEFADFELANGEELARLFPEEKQRIAHLTRN